MALLHEETEVRLEPVRSDESGKGALSTEYQSSGNGTNGQDSKSLSSGAFAASKYLFGLRLHCQDQFV